MAGKKPAAAYKSRAQEVKTLFIISNLDEILGCRPAAVLRAVGSGMAVEFGKVPKSCSCSTRMA
jgi:hypothetical protein